MLFTRFSEKKKTKGFYKELIGWLLGLVVVKPASKSTFSSCMRVLRESAAGESTLVKIQAVFAFQIPPKAIPKNPKQTGHFIHLHRSQGSCWFPLGIDRGNPSPQLGFASAAACALLFCEPSAKALLSRNQLSLCVSRIMFFSGAQTMRLARFWDQKNRL